MHYTRTRNANVYDLVSFSAAMHSPCHKRIVLNHIAKNDQLSTAQRLIISCFCGCFFNDLSHAQNCIHIDARARRTNVYAGTDRLSFCHGVRNAVYKSPVRIARALLHKSRKSANKIDANLFSSFVKRHSNWCQILRFCSTANFCNRSYCHALMDNRDAIFAFKLFSAWDKVFCRRCQAVINASCHDINVFMNTGTQVKTQGNGADIKMLLCYHLESFCYILYLNCHFSPLKSTRFLLCVIYLGEHPNTLRLKLTGKTCS